MELESGHPGFSNARPRGPNRKGEGVPTKKCTLVVASVKGASVGVMSV